MKRLQDRVALISGAASGIGGVTAERLADEGATVAVTDVEASSSPGWSSTSTAATSRAERRRPM
jgi:NAD(P)-dependent dehydrogenase (short-subunit alcohol dehydrogenase family)